MLQCEVIGNLGNDAEIKDFGGKKYVSFSVAHSEVSKDQQGNRVEQTTWVSVLWYGEGGGLLQYLKRGSKVFVRGRQKVKVYSDKNGNAQCTININASEVQLCGIKSETTTHNQVEQSTQVAQSEHKDDLPF
jgi:single-strand DNA-binding protein